VLLLFLHAAFVACYKSFADGSVSMIVSLVVTGVVFLIAVAVLRFCCKQYCTPGGYGVPLFPLLPALSMFINTFLLGHVNHMAYERFAIWTAVVTGEAAGSAAAAAGWGSAFSGGEHAGLGGRVGKLRVLLLAPGLVQKIIEAVEEAPAQYCQICAARPAVVERCDVICCPGYVFVLIAENLKAQWPWWGGAGAGAGVNVAN
jgi:hypothetical protein